MLKESKVTLEISNKDSIIILEKLDDCIKIIAHTPGLGPLNSGARLSRRDCVLIRDFLMKFEDELIPEDQESILRNQMAQQRMVRF
jgi:hypothetical protein